MKFLLVDDHALLRDSLSLLLCHSYGDELQLLEASDGRSAMVQIEAHPDINLILLDIDLPDIHGFQILKWFAEQGALMPVLAMSGNDDPQFIRQCISLGATGFLPKASSGETMLFAIDKVLGGSMYQPEEKSSSTEPSKDEAAPILTVRQLEVLRLLRKGLSNVEVAAALNITLSTVKTHIHAILEKLCVKNRTEAVNEALLLRLI